jgi:putative Mg2+ transporter-C (MgtC) family protein
VTGIGFLGAGAIIRQGISVRGLTTAATLWVVAAVGMACGAGYYSAAVLSTGLVLLALYPLRILAYRIVIRFRPDYGRLVVEIPISRSPGEVVDGLERLGLGVRSLEVSQEGERRLLELELDLPHEAQTTNVVTQIADLEPVAGVRWAD